jgi:hypothetical protein
MLSNGNGWHGDAVRVSAREDIHAAELVRCGVEPKFYASHRRKHDHPRHAKSAEQSEQLADRRVRIWLRRAERQTPACHANPTSLNTNDQTNTPHEEALCLSNRRSRHDCVLRSHQCGSSARFIGEGAQEPRQSCLRERRACVRPFNVASKELLWAAGAVRYSVECARARHACWSELELVI